MIYEPKKAKRFQARYSEGTRIRLTAMLGEADMSSGLLATVDFVDDTGQLHMKWDNGRSLALDPSKDLSVRF